MISQSSGAFIFNETIHHLTVQYPCIKEVIIIFFVHKSFTQISIKGFTLRRRVAFLHEMDITVRQGSSLYPWETENPFIGWAWKPDWRKWIIGNRSVPAVIMLQRRCRTLPQRWGGMGASFSLVSLTFFHIVNTVILSSCSPTFSVWLSLPSSLSLPIFLLLFHVYNFCRKHTKYSGKFLTNINPSLLRNSSMSVGWLLK